MDYSLFDDAKCISMIYKEKMPDLQNIEILKIVIKPGDNSEISICVDTRELPQEMPSDWMKQEVSTVQIWIAFSGLEFIEFNLTNGKNCDLDISDNNGRKRIRITNNTDRKRICFDAKRIYAKNISACAEWP
jgi:hypothetical protein